MIIGIDASRANVSERTGTERYAWEVIHRIVPQLHQHQVRLYVREPLRSDLQGLGSHVHVRVLSWPPAILWSHVRLSWELFWHRPDLLFVPADTVPLFHPRWTVTTIHDVAFERFPELYRQASVQRRLGWLRPFIHALVRLATLGRYSASERDYHRWSVRHAIRSCPRLLTVSEFSKQEIVRFLGANPNRIAVTPLGVRQPKDFSLLTIERKSHLLKQVHIERPYFLFLGRLEKKKNITLLAEAYSFYRQRSPQPLDLVLIGTPGYGWEEARDRLDQPSVKPFVHQLGWQSDQDALVLQAQAQAFLFLSHYEGFGIPALESLSAGVPVVASRHGSLPEVLGDAAYFVTTENLDDVVDGFIRIQSDQQLRQRLIERGLQRVRSYTWESTAQATLHYLLPPDLPQSQDSGIVSRLS